MEIIRIGKNRNMSNKTDRITFELDGEQFTITPERGGGFRIHKHQITDSKLIVAPGCANEIVVY